jgi:predicted outer membrane repeat protein
VCGSSLTENTAKEGGGAIFFVSNDRSGALHIDRSHLSNNPSLGFESDPGIFVLAGEIDYTDSVIE